ncbi:MAG: CHAD domain-containing protein [Pseudomonadota bacterium]|nr:CHAD domain-containing protein [Pseudomonadota bacterium]
MATDHSLSRPIAELIHSAAKSQAADALARLSRSRPTVVDVHETRKACKRLRALIVLLRGPLGRQRADEVETWVRLAANNLGALREAAVRRKTLDALTIRHPSHSKALEAVGVRIFSLTDDQAANDSITASRRYLKAASEKISALSLPPLDPGRLERGLAASYKRARKAFRAMDENDSESVHEWRKKLKRHTDQCVLLEPFWPALGGKRIHQLNKSNNALGDHHDLADLCCEIDRIEVAMPEIGTVCRLARREQAALLGKARRLGRSALRKPARRWSPA